MNEKRVAFVTGGSRGIGEAIVRRLAQDGLHVIAVARSAEKLNLIIGEVRASEGSAESIVCDEYMGCTGLVAYHLVPSCFWR